MTREAERMAEIVTLAAPMLKEAGFRKARHTFNRRTDDGLVHVVHFWMAPKEPPAWTEVPGLRPRLYGTFRIDVGVHVPEMTRTNSPRSSWINDYDCQLRRTMSQLQTGDDNDATWWPLFDPAAIDKVTAGLTEWGMPWLAQFPDHAAIIERFLAVGSLGIGLTPAGALDVADMLAALGRGDEALAVLRVYVSTPVLRTHAGYLAQHLEEIGHGDLAPLIRVRDT